MELCLASTCPLILSQNICTSLGLCNGVSGTLVSIIYKDKGKITTQKPEGLITDENIHCLLVNFPSYVGKYKWFSPEGEGVPIFEKKVFPVQNSYASTIHKIQGKTVDKLVVHLGNKTSICPGIEYVAISRVRKLEDLIMGDEEFPEEKLLRGIARSPWLEEEQRLIGLDLSTFNETAEEQSRVAKRSSDPEPCCSRSRKQPRRNNVS